MALRAAVVGSGPNGLAAAITLARAGARVAVYEMADGFGGSVRTLPLTLPGFQHDIGAAVFPLGFASPFFRSLPLNEYGFEWVHSPVSLAHPFDDSDALLLSSLDETARGLGRDGEAWRRTFQPLCERWEPLLQEIMQPMVHLPQHPVLLARFGAVAALPATVAASRLFREEKTRTLFLGLAGHVNLPLNQWGTAAIGFVIASAAHVGGWPVPRGGAQSLSDALVLYFKSLGGEVICGETVQKLPEADIVMLDTSLSVAAQMLGSSAWTDKSKYFEYGPGVYKVDWALSGPIPWRDHQCVSAATVHLGGTSAEIVASEEAVSNGRLAERPFVLLSQPSLFDPSRAPEGSHTAWAYCHVPAGSAGSALVQIEAQVERFAPGFKDVILARHTYTAQQMEAWNPNLVGGDISGGAMTLKQTLLRPSYRTPLRGVYLCSSSTPPGGGVHGMCGHNAAMQALKDIK